MSDQDRTKLGRIQSVLTALLKHQMNESLALLDDALDDWRDGAAGPFDAHAKVIEHVARAKQMAGRVAQIRPGGAAELLRDAFDLGLLEREEFVNLVGEQPEDVEPASSPTAGLGVDLPRKRELVDQLLARGPILVHLDGRGPGVSVPASFRQDPRLVLRFGYQLTPAIADLSVDEHGIAGTLTFAGTPHYCEIPWAAVYAVVSEADRQGMVWPEDVPEAVLEQMQLDGGGDPGSLKGPVPARTVDDEPPEPSGGKPRRRPSYLKLVK